MNIDEELRALVESAEDWKDASPSMMHAYLQGVIATEGDVTEADLEAAMVKEFGPDWRSQSGRAKEE